MRFPCLLPILLHQINRFLRVARCSKLRASLPVPLSVCMSGWLSVSVYVSVYLCRSLSVSLSFCVSVSLFLFLSVSVCLSYCFSIYVCINMVHSCIRPSSVTVCTLTVPVPSLDINKGGGQP